jgi:hypothetical protein
MNTTTTTPETDRETAMRHYIIQQGQAINQLNAMLDSSVVMRGFKAVFSVLLEIVLYLLFAAVIVLIVLIPTDPFVVTQEFGRNAELSAGFHSSEVTALMVALKIALFILSLPVLLGAMLLRRNRRKSFLIGEAAEKTAGMKAEYEKMFYGMKL